MSTELDNAVQRAVAILTLGISDALGPVRPVAGLNTNERRQAKTLLRAIERAYVELAPVSAQTAYDNMAAHEPTHKATDDDEYVEEERETYAEGVLLVDDRSPSVSVRAILSGLPTLGKR